MHPSSAITAIISHVKGDLLVCLTKHGVLPLDELINE